MFLKWLGVGFLCVGAAVVAVGGAVRVLYDVAVHPWKT